MGTFELKFARTFRLGLLLAMVGVSGPIFGATETVYTAASRQDPLGDSGGSARAVAMGSAFVGVSDDVSALLWNPAGLSSLGQSQLFLHHSSLLASTFQEVLMFGVPTPGAGSLGFEGSFIGYGSFDGRDASGLSTGTYGASQFGIGMGWGKKLIGDLAVGLSLHGSQQNLGNGMSFLFGTDAGLLLRTKDGWGAGLSYDGFGLGNTSQDLAASLRVGASKEWTGKSLSLITSLGGSWEPQGGSSLQVGMEGGYGSVLFLRAGYNLQLQTTGFSGFQGFSAGAGIVLDSIHVDYAFVPYGDLGNTHLVSVGYSFGEPPVVAAPKPAVPMTAPAPATVYVQQPSPTPAPSLPPVAPKPVEDKGALQTERTITMEFEVPANDAIVQARNLAKAGQWNPAISVLSDAIKKNPSDAAAWRELGNVYYQVKRKDYAIQCFEKVLRLKPDDKALADWLERYKGH